MTADPSDFRIAMRQWTSGVAIVTSTHQGVWHGMTVSSFTSISVAPPLVLISLASDTRTFGLVRQSGIFGVTLLERRQKMISERFAGRLPDSQERFAGIETFHLVTGAPLIRGGLAFFDCAVIKTVEMGLSTLFIAEVQAAQSVDTGSRPLTYFNRAYHELQI